MTTQNLTPTARTFADACYDDNTPTELRAALAGDPDPTDCSEWGLTGDEWRAAIATALAERIEDSVASTVSEIFGGDGQEFETDDGHSLDEICRGRGATVETDDDGQRLRYLFADGSAIVDCGSAWDIEGSAPFSWAE